MKSKRSSMVRSEEEDYTTDDSNDSNLDIAVMPQECDVQVLPRSDWEHRKKQSKLALKKVEELEKLIDWIPIDSLSEIRAQFANMAAFYALMLDTTIPVNNADLGYFSILPTEVILTILAQLPIRSVCRMACVCKEFRTLAEDSNLWRILWESIADFPLGFNAAIGKRDPGPCQAVCYEESLPVDKDFKWLCKLKINIFDSQTKKNGPGTYIWSVEGADGSQQKNRYSGDWVDDQRQGYGTFFWSDSSLYAGTWHEDHRDGFGIRIWPNGNKYVGEYHKHKRHGTGEFTFSNGSIFKGRFDDNKFVNGTYTWPNGRVYNGEWSNVHRHGKGSYWWPDKRQYHGEWKSDKRHGHGIYKWPDGDCFEGEFVEGRRYGKGVLVCANGDEYEQQWREERFEEFYKGLDEPAYYVTSKLISRGKKRRIEEDNKEDDRDEKCTSIENPSKVSKLQ